MPKFKVDKVTVSSLPTTCWLVSSGDYSAYTVHRVYLRKQDAQDFAGRESMKENPGLVWSKVETEERLAALHAEGRTDYELGDWVWEPPPGLLPYHEHWTVAQALHKALTETLGYRDAHDKVHEQYWTPPNNFYYLEEKPLGAGPTPDPTNPIMPVRHLRYRASAVAYADEIAIQRNLERAARDVKGWADLTDEERPLRERDYLQDHLYNVSTHEAGDYDLAELDNEQRWPLDGVRVEPCSYQREQYGYYVTVYTSSDRSMDHALKMLYDAVAQVKAEQEGLT